MDALLRAYTQQSQIAAAAVGRGMRLMNRLHDSTDISGFYAFRTSQHGFPPMKTLQNCLVDAP